MKTKYFILAFLISIVNISKTKEINKDNVIIGINCGGEEFEGHDGVIYQEDNYFNKGTPSDYGIQYEISHTKDEELYQTERWADGDLTYSIPFDALPGKYIVILKFSEVYFSSVDEKVFDIALGSKIIINDLDIYERVGKAKAHDEYIEFSINDDKKLVYINKVIEDAYDNNTNIFKITFKKGKYDNPKINAIVLYKGEINNSEYKEKKKRMEQAQKKKIQKLKMKNLLLKKHDIEEEFDEDLELSTEEHIVETKKENTIYTTLLSPIGSIVIGSLFMMIGIWYAIDKVERRNVIVGSISFSKKNN